LSSSNQPRIGFEVPAVVWKSKTGRDVPREEIAAFLKTLYQNLERWFHRVGGILFRRHARLELLDPIDDYNHGRQRR
jgi:hypothetical protein